MKMDLEKGLEHGGVTFESSETLVDDHSLQVHFDGQIRTIPRRMPNAILPLESADATSETSAETSATSSTLVSRSPSRDGGARKPLPLPPKHGSKFTRYLFGMSLKRPLMTSAESKLDNFFSYYRKLFAFIFAANLIVFIVLISRTRGTPSLASLGTATSANLLVALLFRQENFVNLVYELFTCWPHSVPLAIRRRLAKVFHYGGCHSGCGTAAVVWYIMYTIVATKEALKNKHTFAVANMGCSYVLILMFIAILAGAHPRIRVKFHDGFEMAHRFAGWTALCTFWIHTYFAAEMDRGSLPLWRYFVTSPNFWFLLASTSCSLLSWSRLRRREVVPEVLSSHATRLHFKYRNMKPFYGIKLSDRPLFEWHAFATIPEENGKGFSVVVSNAGDWTRKQINEAPKKLWVRGYPLHGLLYTSRLFKRIVVVATGSGIGPCLSLMHANVTPRRILWSTPNPETTYGDNVVKAVQTADPKAVIWNTKAKGRPDMVALTHELFTDFQAEAVFIISNPKVTRKVVYGMEVREIPAYGAIFDS